MTANPPEPVEDPTSYSESGYDDRQTDGMDATDAQAIATCDRDRESATSDAERVTQDSVTDPPNPATP
jgi:hypothetical protein